MTASDPLIRAFAGVTFAPATASKRFAKDMLSAPTDYVLTTKQEAFAWRLAYIFRRQMPKHLVDVAMQNILFHDWQPVDKPEFGNPNLKLRCSVCLNFMWSERERNRPCCGPPTPRKSRNKKATESIEQYYL